MINFQSNFKRRIPTYLLYSGLLISPLVMSPTVHADALNAEKELHRLAKKQHCQIVTKATQKGDSVARLETEHVIAVWCTRSPQESKPLYDILIAIKDSDHDWVDCPGLIPISATHTPPLIEIKEAKINGKTEQLDKYNYLSSDPSAAMIAGPEAETADGDGLYIGHWDAEQTLYCYDDQWLVSEFH